MDITTAPAQADATTKEATMPDPLPHITHYSPSGDGTALCNRPKPKATTKDVNEVTCKVCLGKTEQKPATTPAPEPTPAKAEKRKKATAPKAEKPAAAPKPAAEKKTTPRPAVAKALAETNGATSPWRDYRIVGEFSDHGTLAWRVLKRGKVSYGKETWDEIPGVFEDVAKVGAFVAARIMRLPDAPPA